MEESEIHVLKNRAATSIIFLSFRNIGIQAISTLGFFLLTILLGTGEVGLFAVVAESVGILGYFSDIGLASALIQQKEEPDRSDLQTTFVIQQILVILALVVVSLVYPSISRQKSYGDKELWILVSLCFSFAVASLKTIPSILMERQLNFRLLSTIDIIENACFYLFAVVFAFFGFGVYSYAFSTIIRSMVGLLLIYYFRPWPVGFSFSVASAKRLFKFGIPFQLNSFIAMAKDRLSTLLVAGILGRDSFGILAWAQKGPRLPLSFMDAIMKVTFPAFSRFQDRADFLKLSIEKSIFYIAFLVFPALAGIALIAPDFIEVIPKYTKWTPAIIPMYFFAVNAAIAAITTPLTNAFNAVGKITITTRLMIMWTVLTWIFYPFLSYKYGIIGTSAAALIVGSSSFIVWFIAHRLFDVNVFQTIKKPLFSSLLLILALYPLDFLLTNSLSRLTAKILLGASIYLAYHLLFSKPEINWFISHLPWRSAKS